MIERKIQLTPVEVKRDKFGYWIHPEYQKYLIFNHPENENLSQFDYEQMQNFLNVDFIDSDMYDELTDDQIDQYLNDGDQSIVINWTPKQPRNDAFLVCIFVCVDGVLARWAVSRPSTHTALVQSIGEIA
ncbi:hypothetical protein [Acinetobacter bereziniae]|uniref:hypothetical protein n=1 Tax=Acinetobacter bereziniae TaxID=106648 RepID=UPI001901CAC0|nr:hypothetical protein [Acinetobacter bereziniae]MBJ8477208.1 hypothetical protein [Acinetobacter bereziniae]